MTSLPLVFDAPRRGPSAPPPRRPRTGRAAAGDHRAGAAGVPRRPAGPPVLRPARARPAGDDRSAGRGARARRRAAPGPAARGAHRQHRCRDDPQDPVAPARRRARRERAHAVPGPRHRVHLQPGRLRDGLPVLRDRAGRADPQPVDRRDRRAGARRRPRDARRARRAAVQRRVHGHGRAARELPGRSRRRCAGSSTAARPASACRGARSPCRRSGWSRRSASSPRAASASRSPCRCTRPDDELRDTLVPINTRWKVAEVLAAADAYAERTGRRYSIEYAMIRDVNDQAWRAELLGDLLAPRLAHVNLIPLNPTPGLAVGRLAEAGRARVRRAARGPRRGGHGPRHPRPRDRRRLRAARRLGVDRARRARARARRVARPPSVVAVSGADRATTPGAKRWLRPMTAPAATGSALGRLLRDAVRLDRTQSDPLVSLRNAAGIAAPLAIGALMGNAAIGLPSAIGALQTAFADRPGPYRLRILRMLATAFAAAVTSALAVLCSRSDAASVVARARPRLRRRAAARLRSRGDPGRHRRDRVRADPRPPARAAVGGAARRAARPRRRWRADCCSRSPRGRCAATVRNGSRSPGSTARSPTSRAPRRRRRSGRRWASSSPRCGRRCTGSGHDHGPSVEAYRVLLDEAERIRGELIVLAGQIEQLDRREGRARRGRRACGARRVRASRWTRSPPPSSRPAGSTTPRSDRSVPRSRQRSRCSAAPASRDARWRRGCAASPGSCGPPSRPRAPERARARTRTRTPSAASPGCATRWRSCGPTSIRVPPCCATRSAPRCWSRARTSSCAPPASTAGTGSR